MELKPLGKRVVVRKLPENKKSTGGILLPDGTNMNAGVDTGEIIAVGDLCDELGEGDKVLYARYSGHNVEFSGVLYSLLTIDDILAKVCE